MTIKILTLGTQIFVLLIYDHAFIFKVSESDCLSLLSLTASSPSDLSLPYMTRQIHGNLL